MLFRSSITESFEKEDWVRNEYWENDNGVMCASFINIDLDQLSVSIDIKDLEEIIK